jgi:nitroreductase
MRAPLDLGGEELLRTTRAVRRRLDFDRPVSRDVLRACVELALQARSGCGRTPHRPRAAGVLRR